MTEILSNFFVISCKKEFTNKYYYGILKNVFDKRFYCILKQSCKRNLNNYVQCIDINNKNLGGNTP